MDYLNAYRIRPAWLVIAALATVSSAFGADPDRGRMLLETHCVSCHDSRVYKRDSKLGTNYEEIRKQVVRWETNTSRKWNDSDIDSVATHLARLYYKVPCPAC